MAEAEDPIVVEDQDNPPCNLVPAKVGRPQHEASQFLETLNNFNKKYGVVSCRHPVVARQSLNLFSLFKFVQHYKGFEAVEKTGKWADIAVALGFDKTCRGEIYQIRTNYVKHLYAFEVHKETGKTMTVEERLEYMSKCVSMSEMSRKEKSCVRRNAEDTAPDARAGAFGAETVWRIVELPGIKAQVVKVASPLHADMIPLDPTRRGDEQSVGGVALAVLRYVVGSLAIQPDGETTPPQDIRLVAHQMDILQHLAPENLDAVLYAKMGMRLKRIVKPSFDCFQRASLVWLLCKARTTLMQEQPIVCFKFIHADQMKKILETGKMPQDVNKKYGSGLLLSQSIRVVLAHTWYAVVGLMWLGEYTKECEYEEAMHADTLCGSASKLLFALDASQFLACYVLKFVSQAPSGVTQVVQFLQRPAAVPSVGALEAYRTTGVGEDSAKALLPAWVSSSSARAPVAASPHVFKFSMSTLEGCKQFTSSCVNNSLLQSPALYHPRTFSRVVSAARMSDKTERNAGESQCSAQNEEAQGLPGMSLDMQNFNTLLAVAEKIESMKSMEK